MKYRFCHHPCVGKRTPRQVLEVSVHGPHCLTDEAPPCWEPVTSLLQRANKAHSSSLPGEPQAERTTVKESRVCEGATAFQWGFSALQDSFGLSVEPGQPAGAAECWKSSLTLHLCLGGNISDSSTSCNIFIWKAKEALHHFWDKNTTWHPNPALVYFRV